MHADVKIRRAFGEMMRAIDVPPAPLAEIMKRTLLERTDRRQPPFLLRFVVAAAVIVAVIFAISPSKTLGVIQIAQERIARIMLWTPPPSPPKNLNASDESDAARFASETLRLAGAQARVSFTIVPPRGLPNDVVRERLTLAPTLVYSKVTRSWSKGKPDLSFLFYRTRGRVFTIFAERYDPRFGPPPAYMFENDSTGGRMLVKHRNFSWRNGDQQMSATVGPEISAGEIEAIRDAMRGVAIPGAVTRARLNAGTLEKRVRIAGP